MDSPWEVTSLDVLFDGNGVDYSYETLGDKGMVGDVEAT